MEEIWMGISPETTETRMIAMRGMETTLLKARLSRRPQHPRALATLLEAIALWEGKKVRAALVADGSACTSDCNLYREAFPDTGGLLYTLDWVPAFHKARKARREVSGMGRFDDLRQMLLFEVAK
jgi:hypothetical protein